MTDAPLPAADTALDDIFIGGGEMARLMKAHDWAATPLGVPQRWPTSLKVAVRLLLSSRFEMWLGWGPDAAFFYNDAYRPTLGIKHPRSLAMPTRLLWSEIWDAIEPRLDAVYRRGESTWDRALRLIVMRNGYPEETYHTFSYSPLLGDGGQVEGVFCAVSEETERVISERRLASLSQLAAGLAGADGQRSLLAAVQQALSANQRDLPFTATYLFDDDAAGPDAEPRLACVSGTSTQTFPATLPWNLAALRQAPTLQAVGLAEADGPWPMGDWDRAPQQAVLVPLLAGADRPAGVLLAALNPYRLFDDGYREFIQLVAGQIGAGLASANTYEAERRRAAALAEAVQMRQAAAEALAQANQQLTEERDRLRRLFAQAPSFMCVLRGPELVFELANDAYLQLIGQRPDIIGLPIRRALPEIEGQGFFELLEGVLRSGQPFVGRNMAVRVERLPGATPELRYVDLVYQPIVEPGGQVGGIFVDGYDVTDQRHAEEALRALNDTLEQRVSQRTGELADALLRLQRESQQRELAQQALRQAQRMEALGQLTGGVAHDFNNLLQVISGNLQLLRRYVAGNEPAELRVHKAMEGVGRGAKLASHLLSFARRQPLEPKVLNVGRLLRHMDDMLRRALGEEVELETVVAGGLWNTMVDPVQLENAILNLAINARDAMQGRDGRLTVEAGNAMLDDDYCRQNASELSPGQYVMVAISDTGSGIRAEDLERVFDPFFSTKPEGRGTGLGLSMVYGFVKQSGGHVKLYSELGQGTTVKMYLPRAMQDEDALPEDPAPSVQGGSETVLVVEDDDAVRETVVGLLTDLGYKVLKAREAAGALSVIDSGVAIDLLFTDVVMPGPMRSPELARRARERLPNVAVLFTSGYTENAIVHGGRLDPGLELLSKPYTREALAHKLRLVLGQARKAAPA